MRKLMSIVGTGVLLLTLAPATLAASPVVPPSRSSGSIVGIAVANGNFTTLGRRGRVCRSRGRHSSHERAAADGLRSD